MKIKRQSKWHLLYYLVFGTMSVALLWYYLSNTLIYFTSNQQFPINSFERFPLTILIFPAEVFSIFFALYFVYTLLTDQFRNPTPDPIKGKPAVGICIPVYNEPTDVVERTLKACQKVTWRGKVTIYILDDSKDEACIKAMKSLSKKYHTKYVSRVERTGYKAGNINNAIKNHVTEDYFAILDSDQAPEPNFLEHTMDYLSDETVCFVQTPQWFINDSTPLERGAKIGTNIFFHGQCVSKANDGAMPFCGTNAVIRKEAFMKVNGFSYFTSTEDIELGMRMNDAGYHGVYVPEVLVKGYAPTTFETYATQQYRWANGNMAIFREYFLKIIFGKMSIRYRVHTLFTLAWWFVGVVTLIYILIPIMSILTGWGTHHTWLPEWIIVMLYLNVLIGIGIIYVSLRKRTDEPVKFTDALIEYSLITNSIFIFTKAAVNAMFKRYIGFVTTQKDAKASGYRYIKWNLILAFVCFAFAGFALFNGMRASDVIGFRTFVPLSIWLLIYSLILSSSIIFVGDTA